MRYLWQMPHVLDASAFRDALRAFAPTTMVTAITSTPDLQINPDKPMARRRHGLIQRRPV
jgi:hypothetical protein